MDILPILPDGLHRQETANRRFAAFDFIRASAALGVVLLHSGVAYTQYPMPGLAWSVRDRSSGVVDFGFWWLELFIMPLFLVLAGFLAWKTLCKRGPVALIRQRGKRLLLPLVFGMLVVLPIDLHCWVLGWVSEGSVEPIKLRSFKFAGGIDQDLWGLAHLWFLQYLFIYVVALACVKAAAVQRWTAPLARLSQIRWMIGLVSAGAIVLSIRPEVVWGFQHSFFPVPSKWIYSGLFFAAGAVVAAHDPSLHKLRRYADRLAAPALCLSVAAVFLGRWHLSGGDSLYARATLAGLTSCGAAMITFWLIGTAARRIDRVGVTIQYLAAASFWIYLVHHPIVGLLHIDLKWLLPEVSPLLKTTLTWVIATGFCVLTYEGLVRKTWLGRWLSFDWRFPSSAEGSREVLSMREKRPFFDVQPRRAA